MVHSTVVIPCTFQKLIFPVISWKKQIYKQLVDVNHSPSYLEQIGYCNCIQNIYYRLEMLTNRLWTPDGNTEPSLCYCERVTLWMRVKVGVKALKEIDSQIGEVRSRLSTPLYYWPTTACTSGGFSSEEREEDPP